MRRQKHVSHSRDKQKHVFLYQKITKLIDPKVTPILEFSVRNLKQILLVYSRSQGRKVQLRTKNEELAKK